MDKLITYLQASYDELLNKVTWPTWNDIQSNAIVVGVASVIIALVIYLMDIIGNTLFGEFIYKFIK